MARDANRAALGRRKSLTLPKTPHGTAAPTCPANEAMEARARRAARTGGHVARKTRRRAGTVDNLGGFMIADLYTNFPVGGFRYDLSAEEVIAWCRSDE